MLGIDPKAARATWTVALILILIAAVYAVRGTLVMFAVAVMFAYLLFPLVERIGGLRSAKKGAVPGRGPALAITYLLVMSVIVVIAIAIGSQVAAEARQLIANPPDVRAALDRQRTAHPAFAPFIDGAQGKIRQQIADVVAAAPRVSLRVLAASANLIDLIVIPILSFFLLKDGRRMRDGMLALLPPGAPRTAAERMVHNIHELLLQYMRALFFLCCTALVVFSVTLSAMEVPYALLLSTVAFFCEFVPLAGPITAAIIILAVSALSGYPHIWAVAVFLAVFRILQDYVISPKLMSHGVELHPLLIIFGVFAGAELGGIPGVFLSVPVLALARLVLAQTIDSGAA